MQTPQDQPRRLTRNVQRRLGGVCGGLAEYFGLDPTLVRVGFVLLAIFSMGLGGVIAYAVLWAIMPAADPNAPVPAPGAGTGGNGALLLGILLVLIGVSMAIPRAGIFWWMTWSMMRFGWPAAIVLAGVLIVLASRRR
ncbi:MAG: PspC domain-containing protein [Dehalococcoidia bacterium]